MQKPATFQKWHDETPDDFVFSLKAPRFVMHRKDLATAKPGLERFLESGLLNLGEKLGPQRDRGISEPAPAQARGPRAASFSYLRVMGTKAGAPKGYTPAALKRWKLRAQSLARDEDVFLYFISGAKERNPQAAHGLLSALT